VRCLKLQTQPDFEQGLAHYRTGDLARAKASFEKVLLNNANDKSAKLYLERIEMLSDRGFPDGWDEVWKFDEK
jgi:adenylate cyclase